MAAAAIRAGQAFVNIVTRTKGLRNLHVLRRSLGALGGVSGAAFATASAAANAFIGTIKFVITSVRQLARAIQQSVSSIGQGIQNLGDAMTSLGRRILNLRNVAVGGISTGFIVKSFSELEQLEGRFAAVFRNNQAEAEAFVQTLSSGLNQSTLTIRRAVTGFQGLIQGLGFGQKEAFELSKSLTIMAQDAAAFNDEIGGAEGALVALQGAIAGSNTEGARRFLSADVVESAIERLADVDARNISQLEKVYARYAIVFEAMNASGATGQAAREFGTVERIINNVTPELKLLAAEIGRVFQSDMQSLGQGLVLLIQNLREWVQENPELIRQIGDILIKVAGFASLLTIIGPLLSATGLAIKLLADNAIITAPAIAILIDAVRDGRLTFEDFQSAGVAAFTELARVAEVAKGVITNTLSGIYDALAGGDLELAVAIFVNGLQEGMLRATIYGIKAADDISKAFRAAWARMGASLLNAVDEWRASFGNWIDEMLQKLGLLYTAFSNIEAFLFASGAAVNTILEGGSIGDTIRAYQESFARNFTQYGAFAETPEEKRAREDRQNRRKQDAERQAQAIEKETRDLSAQYRRLDQVQQDGVRLSEEAAKKRADADAKREKDRRLAENELVKRGFAGVKDQFEQLPSLGSFAAQDARQGIAIGATLSDAVKDIKDDTADIKEASETTAENTGKILQLRTGNFL